ncbi:LysE/ArgO family amino acid transporter [Labrys monachus]|uniref:L-lysine exporter family protein LysE/ArgO n=1 Tax=Labrys monachus TaxID=217067 RepID=A0ABU0F7K9_9HYPH|nr:LysE/ArgO family amino acid transporter [Labrys monachus]MDQ0390596.1 L-lysine exporter family protein LysE/ArgO [Labrys monachus]
MTTALLSGFLLGLSLIVAIGAQNAFVLRQGLRREHVFAVCLACALSDAVLITAGVAGFSVVGAELPWLEPAMRYGGAVFLIAYGLRSFRAALLDTGTLAPSAIDSPGLARTLTTCLAFTWLNPHVYLDTVMLLGSISTQYEGDKAAFGIGAGMASFLFFFSLGYGARLLRPLFARPGSWRVLDASVGMTMCGLALKLVV